MAARPSAAARPGRQPRQRLHGDRVTCRVDQLAKTEVECQVRARERGFAAQPIGDDRVGVRLAEHRESLAEPLDVGRLPGFPREQVLGDHARLTREALGEIRVGELGLRDVHRRIERAVDAHLDQLHERRHVAGHERAYSFSHWAAPGKSCSAMAASVATSTHSNAASPSEPARRRPIPHHLVASFRLRGDDPSDGLPAFLAAAGSQVDLRQPHQQFRVGDDAVEKRKGPVELGPAQVASDELATRHDVGGVLVERPLQDLHRLVAPAARVVRRRDGLELRRRRGELDGALERPGVEQLPHELGADGLVPGSIATASPRTRIDSSAFSRRRNSSAICSSRSMASRRLPSSAAALAADTAASRSLGSSTPSRSWIRPRRSCLPFQGGGRRCSRARPWRRRRAPVARLSRPSAGRRGRGRATA